MKLFSRNKNGIPTTRRPDYDFIAEVEREYKMDDAGFDERYDRMLVDEFNDTNKGTNIEFEEREEKLYDLLDSLFSTRYRLIVTNLIKEARSNRWDNSEIIRDNDPHQILRARMIERGKRRHD
jgi:hypothetical protein